MTEIIERGSTIITHLTVKNDLDELIDPISLQISVKNSSSIIDTYIYPTSEIIHDGIGEFRSNISLNAIGIWEYEWITTQPDRIAGEEIYVIADPISSAPSLASVADYARMYLGGQTWNLLLKSDYFGATYITLAIETVKRRVMTLPPTTPLESSLNPLLLDYLGILVALQLIPSARDAWGSQIISRSVGNDPAEITSYTDRSKLIQLQEDDLMRRRESSWILARPYIYTPLAISQSQMAVSETLDRHVTRDPRCFPPEETYPYPPDSVPYISRNVWDRSIW
jgi:hypothetical protein